MFFSDRGRSFMCSLAPNAVSGETNQAPKEPQRTVGGGNSAVTGKHEGNECVGIVSHPAASLDEVICTVPYVPALTCPVLGQHRCYKWIVILNILSRFMRPSTRGGLRFVLSCVSQPPCHFGDGKHCEPMGIISSWADGIVGWWERAWNLGEDRMEEKVAIGFLFLGVPGMCLDVYLKNQTPLRLSVGAEYVCGMSADSKNVSPSARLTCSVLSQWGPSALQPSGK